MEKGIIEQSLLEKNIEYLEFYSDEEKVMLNKIYNKVIDIVNNYISENSKLLINKNIHLKKNIDDIAAKRIRYTKILNKVILIYNDTSDAVVNYINREKNHVRE